MNLFLSADEYETGTLVREGEGTRNEHDEFVPGDPVRSDLTFSSHPGRVTGQGGTVEQTGEKGTRVAADRVFVVARHLYTTRVGDDPTRPDVIERDKDGLRYRIVRSEDWGRFRALHTVREDAQSDEERAA